MRRTLNTATRALAKLPSMRFRSRVRMAALVRVNSTAIGMERLNASSCFRTKPDRLGSLFGIQMRTLARDDDEISAGYRVGDRHRGRTLEVDDHEVGFFGCALDGAENGIFGHIFDHGQRRGLAGTFCPPRYRPVRIGIDDSDFSARFSQLTCQQNSGCGLPCPALRRSEHDGRNRSYSRAVCAPRWRAHSRESTVNSCKLLTLGSTVYSMQQIGLLSAYVSREGHLLTVNICYHMPAQACNREHLMTKTPPGCGG